MSEKIELDLEIATPTHVGSGSEIAGRIIQTTSGGAYVPDIEAYFEDHPEEIDEFVQAVEGDESTVQFFDPEYARYDLDLHVSPGSLYRGEVSTVPRVQGEPYIPGSSIKGAIRTALVYRILNGTEPDELSTDIAGKKHKDISRLLRIGGNGPRNDILRCLTVRDATPMGPDQAVGVEAVKTYSLSRDEEMQPKSFTNYVEAFQPGTTFETELHIDPDLLDKMIEEYGEGYRVRRLFDGISVKKILAGILDALKQFQTAVVSHEKELMSPPVGERIVADDMVDEYRNILRKDDRYLRIGYGTNFYSNTVYTTLSESKQVIIRAEKEIGKPIKHAGCGGYLDSDDRNEGKLFCPKCMDGSIEPNSPEADVPPFPKTRRLVMRRGTPSYPLGWMKF